MDIINNHGEKIGSLTNAVSNDHSITRYGYALIRDGSLGLGNQSKGHRECLLCDTN
jgi:hypothetical protein